MKNKFFLESKSNRQFTSVVLLISLSVFILFSCLSCNNANAKLSGRWTGVETGAIYEFSKKEFVLNTLLFDSSIMVRGTYKVAKESVNMISREISFDFGDTWEKNDGSLIPVEEINVPLVFLSKEKILLADIEYIRF